MARRKKKQPENRGILKREEVKAYNAPEGAASEDVTGSEKPASAVNTAEMKDAVSYAETAEPEEMVSTVETAETSDSSIDELPSPEETEVKGPDDNEPVMTETSVNKNKHLTNKFETESKILTEEKETQAGMVTDAMPEFLRSANSTIRRDGPYTNYSGNADVLRHKNRDGESGTERRSRKKGKRRKRDSAVSTETISLVALIVIVGAIFVCALRHVEMRELSLAALIITAIITIAMGVLLGDTPSYVTLIVVALIIIAGAITGMFSEVITGVVMFLGTVLAIKGRFE